MSDLEIKTIFKKVIHDIERLFFISRLYKIVNKELILDEVLNKTYDNDIVSKMKKIYEIDEKIHMIKTLNIVKMMKYMNQLNHYIKNNNVAFLRNMMKII
jgi:hypothetical protein